MAIAEEGSKMIGTVLRISPPVGFAAAALAVLVLVNPARAAPDDAQGVLTPKGGNMREGLWVLNQARSKELSPGDQTLWIIKDDGKQLVWVSVIKDAQGRVKVSSFDGPYNGDAVAVVGTGMMSRLSSTSPGTIHNEGEIPGVGAYREDCTVRGEGKRFTCEGQVKAKDGVHPWHDDFDWVSPSPQ